MKPPVMPDDICLYYMLKKFETEKATFFKISELENFSWKAVERRNIKQGVVDYVVIRDDDDKEVFETFKDRLKTYCNVGDNYAVLKTEKDILKLAKCAVKNMDEVTVSCCDEALTRDFERTKRKDYSRKK